MPQQRWNTRKRLMSEREGEAADGAFRVGADLRAARERLGWDLPAVAASLRIKQAYLQAIEDGRVADLPGNAYALGFLRTYATALGLDADEVARRFRAEAGDVNHKTELAFPAPVPERGVPAGAIALLGVLLAVGAYAGWYYFTGVPRPSSQQVPDLPADLSKLAPRPATTTQSPVVASVLPAEPRPAAAPPARSEPAPAPPVPPVPPAGPAEQPAAVPPADSGGGPAARPVEAPATAVPGPAAAPAPAAATPAAPAAPRIVLRATANAWVQVREKQGHVLLNRILRAGDSWAVPQDAQPLLLTTGNAGGTVLVVDGVAGPPLGRPGAVRRDLPIGPEAGALRQAGPAGQ